nr:hypothetical protein [Candidatus Saccharicenans sp.]
MSRKNENRSRARAPSEKAPSRGAKRLVFLLLIIALLVVGVFLYQHVFRPASPLQEFWKKAGVDQPNVLL